VETFMYMGMEYPKDSIYAEEMCKHMFAPDFSSFSLDLWEKTKKFGEDNNMTVAQMAEHLSEENKGKTALGDPQQVVNAIDDFLKTKKD